MAFFNSENADMTFKYIFFIIILLVTSTNNVFRLPPQHFLSLG